MNSKLLGRKTEKHEIQMLSCNGELKADEYWMCTETSWIRDIARGQRGRIITITMCTGKTCQFATSYKDDDNKIAELKQQISQKMILLRSTLPKCHCAVHL